MKIVTSWGKLRAPCSTIALVAVLAGGWAAAPTTASLEPATLQDPASKVTAGAARETGLAVTGRPTPSSHREAPGADTATHADRATRPSDLAPDPASAPRAADPDLFRGLGAWIDLFDFGLGPVRTTRIMASHGVRTLYLQTGHSYTKRAIDPRVGPWLVQAHRHGIKVVGWYLPDYRRWRWDADRIAAIKGYRFRGHAFDGLGIDIENRRGIRNARLWSKRVANNARVVRALVGDDYPIASIPPPPLQMRLIPSHWAGFPWKKLNAHTDAFLLMSYWSERGGCPRIRRHCAYQYTRMNVQLTRRLIGDRSTPVHIIGGVGDRVNMKQMWAFARGAIDARADGASIYDVATTRSAFWRVLRNLRDLG